MHMLHPLTPFQPPQVIGGQSQVRMLGCGGEGAPGTSPKVLAGAEDGELFGCEVACSIRDIRA